MAYTEVTLIIDGALSETEIFKADQKGDEKFARWVAGVKQDVNTAARIAGSTTKVEIYILNHAHENDGEDCECIQYINDHHPYWTNGK